VFQQLIDGKRAAAPAHKHPMRPEASSLQRRPAAD
jgi:hypothetical protein